MAGWLEETGLHFGVQGRKRLLRSLPYSLFGVLVATAVATGCGGGGGGGTIIDPPPATATLSGTVRKAGAQSAIANATVTAGTASSTTAADGAFTLSNVPIGPSIQVQVSATGFDAHSQAIAVQAGANTLHVLLAQKTVFEHGDVAAYLPPEVTTFRGAILFLPGSTGDVRYLATGEAVDCGGRFDWCVFAADVRQRTVALARTYGLAVLAMKDLSADPAAAYTAITAALASFASQSGNPQLGQVPLLLLGHSAGGCLAYKITRVHADRVIGFLSGKGGCHEPHDGGILGALSVPGYFFIGEDDEPARAANITTVFEQNRAAGALWALAVEPGAGHQVIRDFGLQLQWMDAVLSRRLPASSTSALVAISEASGWLANRSSFAIAAYAGYADEPLQASWLPSEQTAQAWQAFVQYTETE